jgi:hypothetical protein
MAESILTSTKKLLGIAENYTAFDVDVITHINAAFAILDQLGAGPEGGTFAINSKDLTWNELGTPPEITQLVQSYVYLRVRLLFDPPGTSFLLGALQDQIKELEFRLNLQREYLLSKEVE